MAATVRKILFLDFDGVLHAAGEQEFARMQLFERYLAQMPDVEVVISSSWREVYAFDELVAHFPESIRDRIVDVIPTHEDGHLRGGRQREIEAFLAAAALDDGNACWVAVDDMHDFFDDACRYLIRVDSERGFGDDEGQALLAWYAATASVKFR